MKNLYYLYHENLYQVQTKYIITFAFVITETETKTHLLLSGKLLYEKILSHIVDSNSIVIKEMETEIEELN